MPIQILMPALSPTMTEGNLVRWYKKEGEPIKAGDILAEIETDKATMEIDAVDEGILGKIVVPEGTENVAVNALIGLILEEGEEASALATVTAPESKAPSPVEKTFVQTQEETIPQIDRSAAPYDPQKRLFATPLARRLAKQKGIDLSFLKGSGPHGRIIKDDIERHEGSLATSKSPSPQQGIRGSSSPLNALWPAYEEVKTSNVRKVIAERLTESKQMAPHFYLTVDCELDALLASRQTLNGHLPDTQKISVNDFILKAIAMALKEVPEANASWAGDHIKMFKEVDISVAVASDGGLVTPIVRQADQKSLGAISQEMKELIAKARSGKLKPHEFQGGTFSLSNLGMYGIKNFAAILNPPQGCILAVGAGEQRPVVRNNQLTIATVMTCTLSVDHRVVDGAVGAEFLKHFKQIIMCPMLMMV